MIPSIRVMLPSKPKTKRRIVIPIVTGISIKIVDFATVKGKTTAESPRIINTFNMLLPTMLPIVMSALPLAAAVILTAASGALVPMATIVKPIISCGIPNFVAIPAAPSTNQSEPFTRQTKPKTNNANCNNISIKKPQSNKNSILENNKI